MKRLVLLVLLAGCATAPAPVVEKKVTPVAPVTPPPEPVPAPQPVAAKPLATVAPLTTVLQPQPKNPILTLRLVFHTGSIDDPKGKEGLTALTTRLLAEGGTKELNSSQLLEALYPMSAELDASTDKEFTVWSGRVHQDKLDRYLKIFTDTLLEPRFDPKEFERLKGLALNTIKTRLRGENDEELGKVALDSVLYAGHPYGHYVGGTVKGLEAITLDDVKAHAKAVLTQDRLIIGLAGAADAKLEKKVKDLLSKLPATGSPIVALPAAPGPRGTTLILQRDTLSTAGSFGFTTPLRRGDPDFYAVAFALSYLGEHRQFHGVLFDQLREARGLNYGTYSYAEHFLQEGWSSITRVNIGRATQDVSFWLRPVESKNGVFATRGVAYFLDQLIHGTIPQDRFETARGFLTGYTRIWEQTNARRLGYAIDGLIYGTPDYLNGYRAALEKITPAEMQAAVARHLSLDKLNFVFVTKDAAGLKALLASKAPTPIVYATPKPPEVMELDKTIERFPLPLPAAGITVRDANEFMEQ